MTDHQPEPRRLGGLGATVLGVVGAILLLPGLCSVFITVFALSNARWLVDNMDLGAIWLKLLALLLALWAAGILLGAVGVWLITMTIRALSQPRT
jgi:hypothetical protein